MEQTLKQYINSDTIVAIATPRGVGGIAVIRVSGKDAVKITNSVWRGVNLESVDSHTAHLGYIIDSENRIIDQVVATIFRAPKSYTGENVVEISCHGSLWIQKELINELVRRGCRPANGGEFSQRAFINGRMDLTKAEAVADLIASSSRAAHRIAMSQMRGDFSNKLSTLRQQLLNFVSLIELELDFSEEEVEFADRQQLISLACDVKTTVDNLANSFSIGTSIKDGIPVAIAGVTNVGKSTLLNRLLHEDKAIVSDIHGTTRDVVEDTIEIEGILFRFIDTAGLRKTDDIVENLGIERTEKKIKDASLILWLIDPTADLPHQISHLMRIKDGIAEQQKIIVLVNKSDISHIDNNQLKDYETINISAKTGDGMKSLEAFLSKTYAEETEKHDVIITNARHYQVLIKASETIARAIDGLNYGLPGDLVSQDIRECMHYLAEITGDISTDDLLGNIFANFCIGK